MHQIGFELISDLEGMQVYIHKFNEVDSLVNDGTIRQMSLRN